MCLHPNKLLGDINAASPHFEEYHYPQSSPVSVVLLRHYYYDYYSFNSILRPILLLDEAWFIYLLNTELPCDMNYKHYLHVELFNITSNGFEQPKR